jgi:hypothetical protein
MSRSTSNKKKVATKPKAKAVAAKKKLLPRPTPRGSRAASQHTSSASGYVLGDRVSHPMFGEGVVKAIDSERLTIRFKDGRVKQILDYYVKHR